MNQPLTTQEQADELMILNFGRKQPKTEHGQRVLEAITHTGKPTLSIPLRPNSTAMIQER